VNKESLLKFLKKNTTPSFRRSVKKLLHLERFDEVDIVLQTLERHTPKGTMFDVGAHQGASCENFAKLGWTIYAFEPDNDNRDVLEEVCKKYTNVHIDSRGVAEENRNNLSFFTSDVSSGISSLSAFHDSHKEAQKIDVVSIRSFLKEHEVSKIDFLKIDTEGHDLFVLKGIEWGESDPLVILCEFEDNKTLPLGYSFKDLADFLVTKGYQVLVSEWHPIVQYGNRHQWNCFKNYPCELVDSKAWGNLIASRDAGTFERVLAVSEKYASKYS
jgi:FkbM family methyltransferase